MIFLRVPGVNVEEGFLLGHIWGSTKAWRLKKKKKKENGSQTVQAGDRQQAAYPGHESSPVPPRQDGLGCLCRSGSDTPASHSWSACVGAYMGGFRPNFSLAPTIFDMRRLETWRLVI